MEKWSFKIICKLLIILTAIIADTAGSKTVELTSCKTDKYSIVTSVINQGSSGNENLILWYEERDNGSLFAQKLGSDGSAAWGNYGKKITWNTGYTYEPPMIFPAPDGGAVIIFSTSPNDKNDISALKINSEGQVTVNKISLSGDLPGRNYSPASVVTEHGFIVVAWENFHQDQFDIYAQAIDYNLNKLWNDEQPATVCDYENDQRNPTMATDGRGGVFITWIDNRNSFLNGSGYSLDLYGNRLDHDGNPYTNNKGKLLLRNPIYSISGINSTVNPRKEYFYNHNLITSDENTFMLTAELFNNEGKTYVKVIKANGDLEITGEKNITGKTELRDPRIVSDNNSGGLIIWKDLANNSNLIKAEHFNKDLLLISPINGQVLSCEPIKEFSDRILPDIRLNNSMKLINNDLYINWTATDNNRLILSNMSLTDESDLCGNQSEIQNRIDEGEFTSITTQADKLVVVYKQFNNIFADVRELRAETKTERTFEQSLSNYPNPFNPSTRINFFIPSDGFVSLRVYDITGKEIATVLNEFRTMGEHSVRFNAENLSSGAYFYRLDAGGQIITRRMTILK
ncbi:MAG: T9SS type A sorting domain-containing protein [Bacteroidetes bacterium]|nr:T9SS type A sorting domain-containing protein [Bacteroidota bacterium]